MKKLICACTAALLAVSMLAGCGGQTSTPASESGSTPASQGADGAYVVGVCQLAPHDALDAATQGFQDALKEALGDQVTIEVKNAAGDSPTCATIVNGFVSSGVDLIMANATASLQAAVAATSDIPILGTSVTEYGVALGIEDFSAGVVPRRQERGPALLLCRAQQPVSGGRCAGGTGKTGLYLHPVRLL